MTFQYSNVNDAFPHLLGRVLSQGDTVESRNGTTKELRMVQVTLTDPSPKELTTPGRRVSLPAQIAETMWLLAGRNDIEWLSHYLPRAKDFSDDGKTWRGAYGPRLRQWLTLDGEVDQLAHIVDLIKGDPETRRAVFTIYDPAIDNEPGKDTPCNNWVHFLPRGGVLHAHVAIRSNDLFWGWSGINAFEWTSLLEVVAGLTGLQRGSITFSISSLHLYEQHWERASKILDEWSAEPHGDLKWDPSPAFEFEGSLEELDALIQAWFQIEARTRETPLRADIFRSIQNFPEPMMQSWLCALLAWNQGDLGMVPYLRGTNLFQALSTSPKRKLPKPQPQPEASPGARNNRVGFHEFATKLHAEKHEAYGNSWKKRGEMLGIMANIARKVDRLGVAGGGDTAADTAIDLLVYLVKYSLWLEEQRVNTSLDQGTVSYTEGAEHVARVTYGLEQLRHNGPLLRQLSNERLILNIRDLFDTLEHRVEERRADRVDVVESIIQFAYPLAVRLWSHEEWQTGNNTRSWNPETADEAGELSFP